METNKPDNTDTTEGDGGLSGKSKFVEHLRLFLYGSYDPDILGLNPPVVLGDREIALGLVLKNAKPVGKIIVFGTGGDINNNDKFKKLWQNKNQKLITASSSEKHTE